MKDKIKVLIADIEDDLESISKIKTNFDKFTKDIENKIPDQYQRIVIAYFMHNFYNGCESILKNIALVFENNIDSQSWHKSILKRMKLDIEDLRPAVISEELYEILDDFRAFRHVFRHVYSYELDWEKEKLVVNKFDEAVVRFEREIKKFTEFLRKLVKSDTE